MPSLVTFPFSQCHQTRGRALCGGSAKRNAIGSFGAADDISFARRLIEEAAVATVPASSFYHDPALGRGHIRFGFPKKIETIERGLAALRPLRS